MPIHVEVVTQERKVFDEPQADMVLVPGAEGEMGVLPHHAPLLTTMGFGELVVRKQGREERFVIYGGVVDIRPDKVVVLADLAESSFALDEARIEAARQGAQKMMAEGVPPEQNRAAQLELRRAELALKVKNKMKARGSILRIVEDENGQ
ncbi:MAG TPA: ATP synthase F1 subunit epsilon [Aggregatilineales bacterium]|nr:ATP synthase F1 subunit epsilon [Anaerolineae bacterium]HUN09390.1 ATP synthase F1 subunit epsilon [Aggregatilineales bacterium]